MGQAPSMTGLIHITLFTVDVTFFIIHNIFLMNRLFKWFDDKSTPFIVTCRR